MTHEPSVTDWREQDPVFEAMMKSFRQLDIAICLSFGVIRYRIYHDGAWLEGYRIEPVIYWGA